MGPQDTFLITLFFDGQLTRVALKLSTEQAVNIEMDHWMEPDVQALIWELLPYQHHQLGQGIHIVEVIVIDEVIVCS